MLRGTPTQISTKGPRPSPGDGIVRIIQDCSRADGKAANDFAKINSSIKYQSVKTATKLIKPRYFLAKVDIKSAYRSVSTHSDHWPLAGLQWPFQGQSSPTLLRDTTSIWSQIISGILPKAVTGGSVDVTERGCHKRNIPRRHFNYFAYSSRLH